MTDSYQGVIDQLASRNELARIRGALADRMGDAALRNQDHVPDENELHAAACRAFARTNPLYAAAAQAAHFGMVVPLESGGTEPLAEPSEATRDDRVILDWWRRFPNANPAVVCGPTRDLIGIRLNETGRSWLSQLATSPIHTVTDEYGATYEAGRAHILGPHNQLATRTPDAPISQRYIGGMQREVEASLKAERQARVQTARRQTVTYLWRWPYAPYDVRWTETDDFGRTAERTSRDYGPDLEWSPHRPLVPPGVEVLGDGAVVAWEGARFADGTVVHRGGTWLDPLPEWIAGAIGRRKTRR